MVESIWDALLDALMRSSAVVVVDEPGDETVQVIAVEDEHMIQAFPSEGADESLGVSAYLRYVGFRCSKRCFQFLDTTTSGDFREAMAVLAVAIVN